MDNDKLSKSGNGILIGRESDTNAPQHIFTVDISRIKDLPMLYKLIDKVKNGQECFANYGMRGDSDG